MQIESKKLLEDIRQAAELIASFVSSESCESYTENALVRSGVERQFQIIGEALRHLERVDSSVSAMIPESRRVIAFRNLLVHGYDVVVDAVVWDIVQQDLPLLHSKVLQLLEDD